jgi:hypothetical protein
MELADDVIDLQKQVKLLKKQVSEQEQAIAVLSKAQKAPTPAVVVKQPKPVDEQAMEDRILAKLQAQQGPEPPQTKPAWHKFGVAVIGTTLLLAVYFFVNDSNTLQSAPVAVDPTPVSAVSNTAPVAANKPTRRRSARHRVQLPEEVPGLTKEQLETLKELEAAH